MQKTLKTILIDQAVSHPKIHFLQYIFTAFYSISRMQSNFAEFAIFDPFQFFSQIECCKEFNTARPKGLRL